jgi:cell division protein FtsI/penicillin-binding protein 2
LTSEQIQSILAVQAPNLHIVTYVRRYPDLFLAKHVIGYVGQNPSQVEKMYKNQLMAGEFTRDLPIGGSGLEKSFEPFLRGIGMSTLSFYTDANNKPLVGIAERLVKPNSSYYPLNIVTTLDLKLQNKLETMLDQQGLTNGAVVVLDAKHADIIAMVSRPVFDPESINLSTQSWSNKAVKAVAPGSIFKTVVAAAALDEHVVALDETFDCHGEYGKYGFSCWKEGGHGHLSFADAYAQSCNIVFAEVAKRLTPEIIQQYARKLGLDTKVGWSGKSILDGSKLQQIEGEEKGQIISPETNGNDEGALIQTAIGQRDVLMSPLQAANMVVTIVNGGEAASPRLVSKVDYANGETMTRFKEHQLEVQKPITVETAVKIADLMQRVVQEGTGKSLLQANWPTAGKSGTAQVTYNGKPAHNQWFIGYAPVGNPRYAVAVMVEHAAPESSHQATKLFRTVMDVLAE